MRNWLLLSLGVQLKWETPLCPTVPSPMHGERAFLERGKEALPPLKLAHDVPLVSLNLHSSGGTHTLGERLVRMCGIGKKTLGGGGHPPAGM